MFKAIFTASFSWILVQIQIIRILQDPSLFADLHLKGMLFTLRTRYYLLANNLVSYFKILSKIFNFEIGIRRIPGKDNNFHKDSYELSV